MVQPASSQYVEVTVRLNGPHSFGKINKHLKQDAFANASDGLSFSRIFLQPKIPNLARSTVRRTKWEQIEKAKVRIKRWSVANVHRPRWKQTTNQTLQNLSLYEPAGSDFWLAWVSWIDGNAKCQISVQVISETSWQKTEEEHSSKARHTNRTSHVTMIEANLQQLTILCQPNAGKLLLWLHSDTRLVTSSRNFYTSNQFCTCKAQKANRRLSSIGMRGSDELHRALAPGFDGCGDFRTLRVSSRETREAGLCLSGSGGEAWVGSICRKHNIDVERAYFSRKHFNTQVFAVLAQSEMPNCCILPSLTTIMYNGAINDC